MLPNSVAAKAHVWPDKLDKALNLGHVFAMGARNTSPHVFTVRDDNLRLIFSEAELKSLHEKRKDVIAGFYAIASVTGLTGMIAIYFFATPFPTYLQDTVFAPVTVALGIMGYLGALLTLISPIIIVGLLIELRKAAKARASLIDLLIRYNRPMPADE